VKAFADANPEVLLQGKYFASQPVPASFGKVNYWGVHAFGFVDAEGKKQFGKWIFEPVGGTQALSDDEAKAKGTTSCSTTCASAWPPETWPSTSTCNWPRPATASTAR
jgi:catalase